MATPYHQYRSCLSLGFGFLTKGPRGNAARSRSSPRRWAVQKRPKGGAAVSLGKSRTGSHASGRPWGQAGFGFVTEGGPRWALPGVPAKKAVQSRSIPGRRCRSDAPKARHALCLLVERRLSLGKLRAGNHASALAWRARFGFLKGPRRHSGVPAKAALQSHSRPRSSRGPPRTSLGGSAVKPR